MFILICRYNRVFAYPGDDVTMSSHLSPETSALSMEIRWFKGSECIYLYKNKHVTVGKGYEGRVSLLTQELKSGNVSLVLKSITAMDTGTYMCQVLTGQNKVEKSIHLNMSGMVQLSPDRLSPKLMEQNSTDLDESVLILELKKLLQQRERELEDKTRELEATTEMLRTKSSLLLYTDMDLENKCKLANQKEERLKNMMSELDTYKKRLETLGKKLQEKNAQVEELQDILQRKEQNLEEEKKHVGESQEQQITACKSSGGLKTTAQDTTDVSAKETVNLNGEHGADLTCSALKCANESVHLLELKNLLQNKEKEHEDQTKELVTITGEFMRMKKLLQDRDVDVKNLVEERDECLRHMAGEMEMCLRELEALGEKLGEKTAEVEHLQGILQSKEQELEEEKKHRGQHVITVRNMAEGSQVPVVLELLEKSDNLLSTMYQNSKEQLDEIESWIHKKREERRLREEEERTEALEKEFLDYYSAVKELIGKKQEKILAWENLMAVLQDKLQVVETAEEREDLQRQLVQAVEMQREGGEQIESLSRDIEEKKSAVEEKHNHAMEEIRENYAIVSKIETETNILKFILPDVQAYFQNIAAKMQRTLKAQRQIVTSQIAGERQTPDYTNVDRAEIREHETNSPGEGVVIQTKLVRSIKSSPVVKGNFVYEDADVVEDVHVAGEPDDCVSEDADSEYERNIMVNGMMSIKEQTIEEEEEEVEEEDEKELVWVVSETYEKDMIYSQ